MARPKVSYDKVRRDIYDIFKVNGVFSPTDELVDSLAMYGMSLLTPK